MRLFGSDKISNIMLKMGMEENQNIDSPLVSKAISSAQKKVENRNFEIRKHLLEYDNVMNDQRNYIYGKRNDFLDYTNINEKIFDISEELIDNKIDEMEFPKSGIAAVNAEPVLLWLADLLNRNLEPEDAIDEEISLESFRQKLLLITKNAHEEKIEELGEEIAPQVERFIALQAIDRRWKEHLYEMDGMREGIGYQAYAQKDPLVEYKFQAFNLFQELIQNINTDIIRSTFKVHIAPRSKAQRIWQINNTKHEEFGQFDVGSAPVPKEIPQAASTNYMNSQQEPVHKVRAQIITGKKVGRNEPCPCGSGKKYKYCCGR
jgi:preprotein translocase subunit SecA